MQDSRLVCTLDSAEYKEYELWIAQQLSGIISWTNDHEPSPGSWYTIANDGKPRYFQTQEQVIEFLRHNPVKSANELSAKLKAEANKLMNLAADLEVESSRLEQNE